MKLALAIASVVFAACGTEPAATVDANGGSPDGTVGTVTNVSGTIAADTTWRDTINITANTTIPSGVTVTVAAGTTINVTANPSLTITVQGSIDIQGSSAAKVTMKPTVATGHWNRFAIPPGGQVTAHYLVEVGGGFQLSGGKLTLIDSAASRASGDLVEGTGTVDIEYSAIGLEPGGADSTHCALHFDLAANTLKVTHTNLSTSVYGIMFYGGTNADFTYNNWFSNTYNVDAQGPVSGNFSFGWFGAKPPTGTGVTATNLAPARLTDAGPRP
ncbi:MAG: hypothetical protein JWO36_1960 [Myxococcales bacterium]|nr:hypothetical protein [Myxococcales bacterium]